ncbi:protein of unknown function UPF0153 [Solidesulfovibrio carbinoliphilus subsp. oakridgensis]|uniref:YkgJ family cysteine cluster protein n=1 Tax=Solidesulfovibrio carbinoliphilus subsp. oakridgensis TaxID=694327 RepID=G7QA56_9BACT|nr:YkgJ family cysteine cluster protein [Solidesulfovibrio carbinoliphilus]EHJ48207.1 protein of unknown function UPF0153 [Solidesulfovibrio carbinoliphilus subsp. oakridgensis]
MHLPMPTPDASCRRCGACCRAGGPALHRSDLPLAASGLLGPDTLVTLRRGDHVADNVAGGVGPAPAELVKVRPGPDGRACRFFATPAACSIHDRRPAECRALYCEAPEGLAAMYRQERLTRADLLPPGSGLAALCANHEAATDLVRLDGLCRLALAGDEGARDEAYKMVKLDAAYRQLLPERTGVAPAALAFYLGRPPQEALPACRALLAPGGLYKLWRRA